MTWVIPIAPQISGSVNVFGALDTHPVWAHWIFHMLSAPPQTAARRWPRGQRFSLTPQGGDAEVAYRASVQDARALGRNALEAAERRWAESLGLLPCDGVVLSELRPGRRSLADLGRALESCGTSADEIRTRVGRLVEKGLVEPLPLPSAAIPA